MSNLLDLVKDQLTDGVMDNLSSLIGESSSTTSSAVGAFLPALLQGVISKGSSKSGAESLIGMIGDNDLGGGLLGNLGSLLGGGDSSSSLLKMGGSLLSGLLGDNQSTLMSALMSLTGLKKSSSSSLLSILAPIAMSVIGKMIKSKGLDAGSLMSYLMGEKKAVESALPAGFADFGSSAAASTASAESASSSTGSGMPKWLIPLLLLVAVLAWFLTRSGCNKGETVSTTDDVEMVDEHAGHDHASGDHSGHNHDAKTSKAGSFTFDAKGNLLNEAGNIIAKVGSFTKDEAGNIIDRAGNVLASAGSIKVSTSSQKSSATTFSVDANGNLVDSNGKIIAKKGSYKEVDGYYVDGKGNKLGAILKKVGAAIETAAINTADAFKDLFSKMVKKESGAASNYSLSDIVFDTKSHKITSFSKAEVMGLAEALKAHPDSKIQVQVKTDDGKDEDENKSLSKIRAEVVRDMLVTLGVKKGQISYTGLGTGADKVSVAVN